MTQLSIGLLMSYIVARVIPVVITGMGLLLLSDEDKHFRGMECTLHVPQVMGSNPGKVELRICSPFVFGLEPKVSRI